MCEVLDQHPTYLTFVGCPVFRLSCSNITVARYWLVRINAAIPHGAMDNLSLGAEYAKRPDERTIPSLLRIHSGVPTIMSQTGYLLGPSFQYRSRIGRRPRCRHKLGRGQADKAASGMPCLGGNGTWLRIFSSMYQHTRRSSYMDCDDRSGCFSAR
jgi:hypothetical protein